MDSVRNVHGGLGNRADGGRSVPASVEADFQSGRIADPRDQGDIPEDQGDLCKALSTRGKCSCSVL